MIGVFLLPENDSGSGLEEKDMLPVSDRLLSKIQKNFRQSSIPFHVSAPASEILSFLREFYERFSLSIPQRRIWKKYSDFLAAAPEGGRASLAAAEVPERRSRRAGQKSRNS